MTRNDLLLKLLCHAIWEKPLQLKGRELTMNQYLGISQLAQEQTVTGLIAQELMESEVKLPKQAAMEVYALTGTTRQRNQQLNKAVAELCRETDLRGIRMRVVKGQTLAGFYPDPEVRQSGDIDFIVHPDDMERMLTFLHDEWQVELEADHSEKHVEFQAGGIQYELHHMLTVFAYPAHQRYWDTVVMPALWERPHTVEVGGRQVPTLPPTLNALYTFVHIFFHLIIEGIGLRQFCDWAMLLDKEYERIDADELAAHLRGIGLEKAWSGLGAILTDFLGLPADRFPTPISADDHQRAPQLMANIWEMGNFGHNQQYAQQSGILHGLQHLWRIGGQARRFSHYAPAEAWWRIPYMFKWWAMKLWRRVKGLI